MKNKKIPVVIKYKGANGREHTAVGFYNKTTKKVESIFKDGGMTK